MLPTPTTTATKSTAYSTDANSNAFSTSSNSVTTVSETNVVTSTDVSNITIEQNEIPVKNCNRAAILELPSDGLTRKERQHGWIVIHVLLACYFFWLLATICDDYFVPAIEAMCCSKLFLFHLFFGHNSFIQ